MLPMRTNGIGRDINARAIFAPNGAAHFLAAHSFIIDSRIEQCRKAVPAATSRFVVETLNRSYLFIYLYANLSGRSGGGPADVRRDHSANLIRSRPFPRSSFELSQLALVCVTVYKLVPMTKPTSSARRLIAYDEYRMRTATLTRTRALTQHSRNKINNIVCFDICLSAAF